MDAGNAFGFKPAETLKYAQSLYDKGYLSYPRTQDERITESDARELENNIQFLSGHDTSGALFPLPVSTLMNNKRYIGEVTDHHALLITDKIPKDKDLSEDEKSIYHLVVKRILAAHYPDVAMSHKEIITKVMDRFTFRSKGKELLSKGRHHIIPPTNENDIMLPTLLKGSEGVVTDTLTTKSKTKPPNRYTSSSLIGFMKNAAQAIEDEDRKSISNLPLGTEATRAGLTHLVRIEKIY
nr:DNA topoisomerase I [Cytobacillus firmus]